MNRLLYLLAIPLFLVACNKIHPESKFFALDSVFRSVPDFSGVVLIAEKGKPIFFRAYGYANYHQKIKMDTSSIFELASVSKQFTSAVIMILKEQGKLHYDDSLKNYIPELPYKGITIRHLLNHTSGLPDYQSIMDQYWDKSKVAGNEDCIEYLVKYHPQKNFEPGSKYEYSNTGYMLLATIAERVSGQDFIQFMRVNIFNPVGMTSTAIRTKEEKLQFKNFAWGFIYVPEKKEFVSADSFPSSNYTIWLGKRKGPGRISSTARDLLKWDQKLYTNDLVSQTSLANAFTPATLSNDSLSYYGFGWVIEDSKIGKVVRHSGSNPGYNTHIVRYIDVNKTIILLCNNAHSQFTEVLKKIETIVSVDSNQKVN